MERIAMQIKCIGKWAKISLTNRSLVDLDPTE